MNASAKTAIKRKRLSRPMVQVLAMEAEYGAGNSWLDYGCGKGDDVLFLRTVGKDAYGYDLHRGYPAEISMSYAESNRFDVVTCFYVLNVVPDSNERNWIIGRVLAHLKPGGRAYIAWRNDVKECGYTSRGTWQSNLPFSEVTDAIYGDNAVYVGYAKKFRGFDFIQLIKKEG